jgi:hypothetical protein
MADEKFEEKEVEKRGEKEDEKQHQDMVSSLVGAAFLIWLGVVLLTANMNYLSTFTNILDRLSIPSYDISLGIPSFSMRAVQVFLLGAGAILLFEAIIRLLVPIYRRRVLGTLIGAAIFFSLGLGNWEIVGPLILIAIGVAILVRGFTRRR